MARPILRTREKTQISNDVNDAISDSNIRLAITYRSKGTVSFSQDGHASSDTDVSTYGVLVGMDVQRLDAHQAGDFSILIYAYALESQSVVPKSNDEIIAGGQTYYVKKVRWGPGYPFYMAEVEAR